VRAQAQAPSSLQAPLQQEPGDAGSQAPPPVTHVASPASGSVNGAGSAFSGAGGGAGGAPQTPKSQMMSGPQAAPQPPQLNGSKYRSVQPPPQSTCPSGHENAGNSSPTSVAVLADAAVLKHSPPSHSVPGPQGLKQPPQCSGSVRVSAHLVTQADKLLSILLQTASLLTQLPPEHAFASLQTLPHWPQFALSLVVSTQASPQRVCPSGHVFVGDGPTPVHWPSRHCVPQALSQKP